MLFDFTIDKQTKTVKIVREFDADLSAVWDAFTKPELLDQWVAPKPFAARTKVMDFREGGRRLYAMVSPDGQERWILQTYLAIHPKTHFKLFNVFADKDENPEPTGSEWDYTFTEKPATGEKSGEDKKTIVHISIYNESLERLEKMIELGFKEGYSMSLENLDSLLKSVK